MASQTPKPSNYELYSKSPLFHYEYYPLNQTVDLQLYRPVAEWTGRLILPDKQDQGKHFVKFEVHNAPAPHQNLVAQIVTLKWSDDPLVQEYVKRVTVDVKFTEQSKKRVAQQTDLVYPTRLDGRSQVDPLESLAGSRPVDDMIVKLVNPEVATNAQQETELIIKTEPIQVTGRFVGLVRIESRVDPTDDTFIVRHYNKASASFADGVEERIRIPQVPDDIRGVPRSSNRDIEKSPINREGWYVYGAPDANGIFVVQALEPRALFRLQPQQVISEETEALKYLSDGIWADPKARKGKISTVLLPHNEPDNQAAISQWSLGDKAFVIHTFGGIAGQKGELTFLYFVPGHFAYGVAEVVRDWFTDELRFEIVYYQVYAHNPEGIISGAQTWSTFAGSLWRGWLGDRALCDILVKFTPIVADYNFGDLKLSPLEVFKSAEAEVMARYRVGDGEGISVVSPASSCVQDSNQALYVTIERIESLVKSDKNIWDYVQNHPKALEVKYFNALIALGEALEKKLVPLGIVRSDWKKDVQNLAGTGNNPNFIVNLVRAVFTWRSIVPRRAQDEVSKLFFEQGAVEWVLRTNQVGGVISVIDPNAPTTLLGNFVS
jgi:predicted Abi (CAAX) family protease